MTILSSGACSTTWCASSATSRSSAESGDQAAALLTGGERFDCVVLDLVMPDLDGLGVLARMREAGNTVPVIVQTAHGGIDNVVSAMRAGAVDFVVKPVGAERLQVSLRNALEKSALADELSRIKRSQSGTLTFKDIVTRSPKHAGRAAQRREGRGLHHPGADRRRVRRRQGADRARHPRPGRAAREALRRGQLRRDPRKSRGVDPVRPREGRLHRRDREAHRQIRRGRRAARCSSTRSANCRWRRRSSCCARSRKARSSRSAGASP